MAAALLVERWAGSLAGLSLVELPIRFPIPEFISVSNKYLRFR